jgi:hypothetical protein
MVWAPVSLGTTALAAAAPEDPALWISSCSPRLSAPVARSGGDGRGHPPVNFGLSSPPADAAAAVGPALPVSHRAAVLPRGVLLRPPPPPPPARRRERNQNPPNSALP